MPSDWIFEKTESERTTYKKKTGKTGPWESPGEGGHNLRPKHRLVNPGSKDKKAAVTGQRPFPFFVYPRIHPGGSSFRLRSQATHKPGQLEGNLPFCRTPKSCSPLA